MIGHSEFIGGGQGRNDKKWTLAICQLECVFDCTNLVAFVRANLWMHGELIESKHSNTQTAQFASLDSSLTLARA